MKAKENEPTQPDHSTPALQPESLCVHGGWRPNEVERAAVLPLVTRGNDEASTTRRPSTPRTRHWLSSTAIGSAGPPIRQLEAG